MGSRQRVLLLVVAAVLCIAIGVYYLIPGIYHPLTFEGMATDSHLKHGLLFFGLAVVGFIGAWILSGSQSSKAK